MTLRLVLAELAPARGELPKNLALLDRAVKASPPADLIVLPELFLSGYRVGERIHRLALSPESPAFRRVQEASRASGAWIVVGTPWAHPDRKGETQNVALLVGPSGEWKVQPKRYLPTFGPFEEAVNLSPGDKSEVFATPLGKVGMEICYEVFFPEVSRQLAMSGAELVVVISASPVSSRRLFEKLLPARAVENGCPVAYCNRTGVEDGMVFAGGSGLWDTRGDPDPPKAIELGEEDRLLCYEVPLESVPLWRPMRPVLRDVAARPP
ncbi:MAG: carbon-nitrogen hydrolase family protein [Euryarchaeota archaeon]|nr:carbon-nitrogen hydrolase family protein [Euryarchaeota archaeon]MDE1835220.1 carbon-nitrogen hydrolase family protein [Euryarchaeota archaeon]MDE1880077.1 carbon-nitrogen hydrolase family protein [Euryarchaeota archaeon]MDE2043516.1 carbon-nitrogen hydrolase family protein [Thermoplasmata archaeon]